MNLHCINRLLLFIFFTNCSAMEIENKNELEGSVIIEFTDGQARIIKQKYLDFSPTMKAFQLVDKEAHKKITMPQFINAESWDKVIAPTFEYAQEPNVCFRHEKVSAIMKKFNYIGDDNDKAIIASANMFDFLGFDELLTYKIFSQICLRYELKKTNLSHAKSLESLNPGLAERIYATKPVHQTEKQKSLAQGCRWHEISEFQ
ncbi:MAG TPA: hypothetical protein VHO47_05510 [Candidatus Babeliales bacterium]|nr:hypothetical protein [Candidatus Babeliales bacterium]